MAFNESEPESPRLINLKKLEEDVERDGRSDYFRLRKTWSRALICFLAVMISFQIGLTIAIGRKWLSFMEKRIKQPGLAALVLGWFLAVGTCDRSRVDISQRDNGFR